MPWHRKYGVVERGELAIMPHIILSEECIEALPLRFCVLLLNLL